MSTLDITKPGALEEWILHHIEAINSQDAARFAASCTDDVIWIDPTSDEPRRGRQAVQDMLAATYEAMPDLRVREPDPPHRSITPDGTQLAWEWITYGTMPNEDGSRRDVEFPGVDLMTLREGRIAVYRGYFDFSLLLPGRGGRDAVAELFN